MARRGAMTAIQAALAGLSGGAAGYVRQRELQKEQDRLKKQEERRQQLDMATLLDRGWMTPEQFTLGREEMKVTEPAQRMRLGEQELVRPRTLQQEAALERGRQATMAQKGKTQEAKEAKSALAAVLDLYPNITPADRAAVMAGVRDIERVIPQPRTPTPTDPMIARQRQSTLDRSTAQTYVEANSGDAAKAYESYKRENPAGEISRREFDAAAYRAKNRMSGNADAIQALVDYLVGGNRTTP